MKKTFLILFLVAIVGPLFAQSVNFGIKAGLNEASATAGKTSSSFSNLSGLNAGVFAEFEYSDVSIQPALLFSQKGFSTNTHIVTNDPQGAGSFDQSGHLRLNYLELPVNVLYNVSTKPGKIFFGAGPYYAYALSGNLKSTTTNNYANQPSVTNTQKGSVTFGGEDAYKRSDFGVGALAGIELKNNLLFNISYEFGLTNIYKSETAFSDKNRVLAFSIGYQFL